MKSDVALQSSGLAVSVGKGVFLSCHGSLHCFLKFNCIGMDMGRMTISTSMCWLDILV